MPTTIQILEAHKANLSSAKTFEEYRDYHIAYVEMLIERERLKNKVIEIETAYVARQSPVE